MPPTLLQATTDPHLHLKLLDTHRKSPVGSLFLSPRSWCTRFCCALQESISQSYISSGGSVVGLMVTSSKKTYAIPTPRASVPAAEPCQPVPPQETLKHSSVSVSVESLGPGEHKVCLSPLSVSGRNGFDSKCKFAPPICLAGARQMLPLDMGYFLTATPVLTILLGFF